jgi:hypothetical protein
MKKIVPLPLFALAACTAQPPHDPAMATQAAGPRCIDLRLVSNRHVLPPSAVIFETSGGDYRVELQGSCPSAARATANEIVQTESQSTQLCTDDHIKIYDPTEAKAVGTGPFPQCRVGRIVAVPRS